MGLWDKRSLQNTPYQMSIMSQNMIENTASTLDQVIKMNPVVELSYTPTSTKSWGGLGVNIRGFDAVSNTISNGIPSGSYNTLGYDLERIEVLNGLSGFLYGIGNVGGSVNYVTKKPTLERLTNLTLGSTGNKAFYGHIDLGGKIDEDGKFSYRLNAFKQDGETSIKDQKLDNTLISGVLDWRVTDNLIFTFDASHKNTKTNKLTSSIFTDASASKFDPKQGYAPDWTYSDYSTDQLGLKSLWQINDNFKLRAGYSYIENEADQSQSWLYDNYDGGTYSINYYRLYPSETKRHGAYIYGDIDFETFGIEHTLTIGGSGTKRKSYSMLSTSNEWVKLGNYTLDQINNIAKPNYKGISNNPMYLSSDSENINFLIGDDIRFNDNWGALVGFNYVKTETNSYNQSGKRTGKYDDEAITPTISLLYKPFEDLTVYTTYIESLENGKTVGTIYKNSGEIFAPYNSKQYEIGTKYSISENLLLSSALFRIEKMNDYADETTTPKTLTRDGLLIHEGLELTLTGKLTDNLTVFGGGTLMDLKIDKANSYEGKKPIGTASQMVKLYAEYNIPFIDGLTLTGGAYYTGKSYRDSANTDIIPSYTIYDGGLRYKTKLDKYPTTFIFNTTNITNKKYWISDGSFGNPKNIAFSMKMEF
ncbi:TonB-dependent siderophore receptor [Aliarcobacter vitoriensis]|uniref:TonB-dependent siderophore receptor n=1 Tax=Aliarcobacter vitoriensis TaxID=2011099 RepID=UPI00211D4FD1|nr:TonB-dependent siderophore receptor [Aliarcobacter vitoriensis]